MSDMRINGHGNMTGGEYENVVINGSAKCEGLLAARRILINGTFQCPGVLKSGQVKVNGNFRCDGDMKSDDLNVDGRLKCCGRLDAGRVNCDGMVDVEGDVSIEDLDVDGSFRVLSGSKIESTKIKCDGSIKVDGQISADVIEADGFINAREIVGDRVTIRSLTGPLSRIFSSLTSRAELIEATVVELRGVAAQTVNGQNVTIGPDCVIENLDCSGTLSISPTAQVNNITGDYQRVD